MRIGLLIAHEESPYAGTVRPFINWAKKLRREGYDTYVYLLNCGENIQRYFKNLGEINYFSVESLDKLLMLIKRSKVDVVLSDDLYVRLRYLNKIKTNLDVRTGVYVQILFGVHSIADVFDIRYLDSTEQLIYRFSRFLPFSLLKNQYVRLLRRQDIIIVNSFTTATFLQILYGLDNDGVVYPPVDTTIFKPYSNKTKNSILVYLGSRAGDTNLSLAYKIFRVLKNKNFKIFTLGNKKLSSVFVEKFGSSHLHDISDQELAKVYSMVSFTICPQKWETFGYVAAESIACGTPVIAFNIMGLGEIVREYGYGIPVNNERHLIEVLLDIDKYEEIFQFTPYSKELKYSLDQSYAMLLKILLKSI
ncbi:MAG: glycosyltransferase [Desulfurococcaceae archaeon]